ncbi:flagellar protein FlaG [Marinobacter sediminum]|uniref:flagellar protein FlaG n=1 Tax=Marinobacter sediminum TaxID=256323 RepID=UPI001939C1A4|nr:flagellar protein FlaG [Marinobacter sediminum]
MNGVNLNSPDLKLVRTSEQAPARASVSPRADGRNASAQETVPAASQAQAVVAAGEARPVQSQSEKNALTEEKTDVGSAVTQLNNYVQSVQRDLRFEIDKELGKTIVSVVDQETQKVIRQIPDDVALKLAENLQQEEPLTLFDLKV